jgi:uncharacterized protein HemX
MALGETETYQEAGSANEEGVLKTTEIEKKEKSFPVGTVVGLAAIIVVLTIATVVFFWRGRKVERVSDDTENENQDEEKKDNQNDDGDLNSFDFLAKRVEGGEPAIP